MIKKYIEIKKEISSAITIDNQIPSTPKNGGSTITNINCNTKVLIKEINADTNPLFNAVKKEDEKILIPANIKENEYI